MTKPVDAIHHPVGQTIAIHLFFRDAPSDTRQTMWTGNSPHCTGATFVPGSPGSVARVFLCGLPPGTYHVIDRRYHTLVSNELFYVDGSEDVVEFRLDAIGEVRDYMTSILVIGHLDHQAINKEQS